MRQRHSSLAAFLLTLASTFSASAQVMQPDGTVIPTRTSGDGLSVADILGMRGERNLTAPFTPFNAQSNARPDPQTFRPGCRISFRVIARNAGHPDSFGWYNVVPGRAAAPPLAERYTIVPSAGMSAPAAAGGVGFVATLDIGSDPRYTGGDIGFFLSNPVQEHTYFTERRYQPTEVPGFFYALIYDSRVTAGGFYFAWEDIIRGNDNDFNDLIVLVDNLTCSGGGGVCTVPGAMGACAAGTQQCRNAELTCVSTITPSAETCDGVDNNCNGTVDEGDTLCPTRQVCDRGVCVERCQAELGCLEGFVCSDRGTCVETSCATVTCAAGSICRNGVCRAQCEGVVCPNGQVCRQDRCVDPCNGLTCDRDQVCVAGVCQARCPCRRCGTGETCTTDGVCRAAACASVTCPQGSYCQAGVCRDSCAGAVCPGGGMCMSGRCFPPVSIGDGGVRDGGVRDGSVSDGSVADASATDGGATTDGGAASDAAMDAADGSLVVPGGAGDDEGCGCRAGAPRSARGAYGLLGVAAVLMARRRRRR